MGHFLQLSWLNALLECDSRDIPSNGTATRVRPEALKNDVSGFSLAKVTSLQPFEIVFGFSIGNDQSRGFCLAVAPRTGCALLFQLAGAGKGLILWLKNWAFKIRGVLSSKTI